MGMSLEEYGTGSCINCGFLCKQDRRETRSAVYGATVSDRLGGRLTEVRGEFPASGGTIGKASQITTSPCCFINEANFQIELSDLEADERRADKVLQLITKDRICDHWYVWTQFRSPEKHFEEFKMKQLENDRREFERKLTQMQIDADEKVSKAGMKVGKVGMWIGIGAIILAVAEILTMNEDALLWKWIANIFN